MSEFDPASGLDLGYVDFEKEMRLADLRATIAERLHRYGALERAYDRASEVTARNGSISLPGLDICNASVYRDTSIVGVERGGGVQIEGYKMDDSGVRRVAVRVPAYQISEGTVVPSGGVFDEPDLATMIAAQGDDLASLAAELGLSMRSDLTALANDPFAFEMTVMTCPVRDEI